jgi:hypothetical protein
MKTINEKLMTNHYFGKRADNNNGAGPSNYGIAPGKFFRNIVRLDMHFLSKFLHPDRGIFLRVRGNFQKLRKLIRSWSGIEQKMVAKVGIL